MTINELFAAVTTSRIDLEDMIARSENNEETFRHIMWHIPNGIRYTLDEEMANNVTELINKVAEALGVEKNTIFNEDGIIDMREELAGGSKIDVELEPTERPSVNIPLPTPAPTED